MNDPSPALPLARGGGWILCFSPLDKGGNFECEQEVYSTFAHYAQAGGLERYHAGTNLVLLDPDIAQAFPNEVAVNEALRMLIQTSISYEIATLYALISVGRMTIAL